MNPVKGLFKVHKHMVLFLPLFHVVLLHSSDNKNAIRTGFSWLEATLLAHYMGDTLQPVIKNLFEYFHTVL